MADPYEQLGANLSPKQKLFFHQEYDKENRSPSTALVLALLLGGLGAHRFYLRQWGWGIAYVLFSWTFIPVLVSLVECFLIRKRTENYNKEVAQQIMQKMKIIFSDSEEAMLRLRPELLPQGGSRLATEVRDERECPHCAGRISKNAPVCRHCGRDAEPLSGCDSSVQTSPPTPSQGISEIQRSYPQEPKVEPVTDRLPVMRTVPQFRLLSDGPDETVLPRQINTEPQFGSISELPGKMNHVAVAAVVLLVVIVGGFIYGLRQLRQQATELRQGEKSPQVVEPVPSPPKASRILSKDAEFVQLLHPSMSEDDVLAHSNGYLQRKKEIDAKLASIRDPELRERLSNEEWAKVDKQKFIVEGEDSIRVSTSTAMLECLERHRADWFEIGHVDYPGPDSLVVKSVEESPIELPEGATIDIDSPTMDGVYSKFREAAKRQIEEKVAAWMSDQSCKGKLENTCKNLGGSSTECSDPAQLREIEERLGPGGILNGCNDNPSADEGSRIAEKELRNERLVLVGQGDMLTHRIDKLLLVDYESEAVLLEILPTAMTRKIGWKFPDENPNKEVPELYQRFADTDSLKDFGAVAVHGESGRQTFQNNNVSEVPIPIEVSLQGDDENNFVLQNNCSSGSVDPHGTCDFTVYFSPVAVGLHTATLVIGGGGWQLSEINLRGYGKWPWDIYGHTPLKLPTQQTDGGNPQPSVSEQSVRDAVAVWVNAFRSKDAIRLSDCYAPIVEKYFRATSVSHERVQQMIQSAFAKIVAARTYEVKDLRVSLSGTSSSDNIPDNKATATFRKTWDMLDMDGKSFSGDEIEQLTFAASPQGWKIIREEELKILRASRR